MKLSNGSKTTTLEQHQSDSALRCFDSTMSSLGTLPASSLSNMDYEYFQGEIDKFKHYHQEAAADSSLAADEQHQDDCCPYKDKAFEAEKHLKKFVDIC